MRFPLLFCPSLAAVLTASVVGAINAEAPPAQPPPQTEAPPAPKTIPFPRTGRAFLPELGCSLVVAKGWHKQIEGNSVILLTRAENGQQANIIGSVWKTPGTVQDFAKDAVAKLEPTGYKVGRPEAFSTFAKLEGIRFRADAPDGRRAGVQYLFPTGDGHILTFTGTFDSKDNADFEQVTEICMKTFHLLDRPHNLPAELGTEFGDKRAKLTVPLGWDVRADVKDITAFGPPVIHHNEQLFLHLDKSALSLAEYVQKEAGPNGEKCVAFTTAEGAKGFKVRGVLRPEKGKELNTVSYIFDGPTDTKVVLGASADADQWPAIEKLFDASAKTLRIGK